MLIIKAREGREKDDDRRLESTKEWDAIPFHAFHHQCSLSSVNSITNTSSSWDFDVNEWENIKLKRMKKKKMTEKTKFKMKAQNRICFKLLMREGRYGIFLSCLSKRRKRPQSYLTRKYMSQMALFIGENQCI